MTEFMAGITFEAAIYLVTHPLIPSIWLAMTKAAKYGMVYAGVLVE